MAKSAFYLSTILFYFGMATSSELITFYRYQGTLAALLSDESSNLLRCWVKHFYTTKSQRSALTRVKNEGYTFQTVTLQRMQLIMNSCNNVKDAQLTREQKRKENFIQNVVLLMNVDIIEEINNLNINVPTTKWCGPGSIAKHYNDLGSNKAVDKCCRKHDLCPILIYSNDTKYGIHNTLNQTMLHCVCDNDFDDCLKNIETSDKRNNLATITRFIYFSIGPNCITGTPENGNMAVTACPRKLDYIENAITYYNKFFKYSEKFFEFSDVYKRKVDSFSDLLGSLVNFLRKT